MKVTIYAIPKIAEDLILLQHLDDVVNNSTVLFPIAALSSCEIFGTPSLVNSLDPVIASERSGLIVLTSEGTGIIVAPAHRAHAELGAYDAATISRLRPRAVTTPQAEKGNIRGQVNHEGLRISLRGSHGLFERAGAARRSQRAGRTRFGSPHSFMGRSPRHRMSGTAQI
jgi:hypothetical protein